MSNKTILALGVDIKNRILFAKGNSLYFGADIGDLSEGKNFALFKREVGEALKKAKPNIIVCDLHPGYFSSRFAKELNLHFACPPKPWRRRAFCNLQFIQHHHAHIASVMREHNLKKPVIGVSFDGTGYGEDGNSWGGEFLLVKRRNFKRLGHLKYRMMPGGDKVVSEPWRMLLSILGKKANPFLNSVSKNTRELVMSMMSKGINSPKTSSAGRLFDAAAALLGICLRASYEAEGPIALEKICDQNVEEKYNFKINTKSDPYVVDTDGLFLGMIQDLKKGKDKGFIAGKFHNSMVGVIVEMARKLSENLRIKDIALSGGVFQNNFLKKRAMERLSACGLNVFTNVHLPVNDLNISLGQYHVSCCTGKS